jgi:selenocysteine lyase/cysteine desulfurase
LRQSRALLAELLHCPVDELVLCPNVTTATNTVLHNLRWEEGDTIVYTSGVYGATEKTIDYIVETTPAKSVRIELDLPQGDDVIVDLFRDTLRQQKTKCSESRKGRVRIAVFDTIVSMPGLRMPFERLVQVCREEGVLSLVDAAHGVGHIPLNLGELDPDFLVTNCHKWLFVPRSVAAFFVPARNQHYIRTTMPTSHGFQPQRSKAIYDPMPTSGETNAMVKQFEYFGTIDGAPYCCIEEAIRFLDNVCGGDAAIHAYCTSLAREAERILVETLGTETFDIPETHRIFFAHVRLPLRVGDGSQCDVPLSDVPAITQFMNKEFVERYHTFVYVLFYRGAWWVRLSLAVYVDLEDCKYAAFVLKDLSERVKKGAYQG